MTPTRSARSNEHGDRRRHLHPPRGRTRQAWQPVAAAALLLCVTAAAQDLRDAGYGDGSLVDAAGQYYYRQANGSYMDVYGATFSPIGDGLYTDALGNRLATDLDGSLQTPVEAQPPRRDAPHGLGAAPFIAGAPTGPAPDGSDATAADPGLTGHGQNQARTGTTNVTADRDFARPARSSEIGSMYLEDVGDGYFKIDPDQIAADPRLAEPPKEPAGARQPAGTAGPSTVADTNRRTRPEPAGARPRPVTPDTPPGSRP